MLTALRASKPRSIRASKLPIQQTRSRVTASAANKAIFKETER